MTTLAYRPDFSDLSSAALAYLGLDAPPAPAEAVCDGLPGTWVDDDYQLRCSDCGAYLDGPDDECQRCRHTDAALEARRLEALA